MVPLRTKYAHINW